MMVVDARLFSAALRLDMAAARMAAIDEAGDARRQVIPDELGIDAVAAGGSGVSRISAVIDVEQTPISRKRVNWNKITTQLASSAARLSASVCAG